MPLEKKARVPVRRHVSSSFARIFMKIFSFFFAFSSQNFDKEETKKQELIRRRRKRRIFV